MQENQENNTNNEQNAPVNQYTRKEKREQQDAQDLYDKLFNRFLEYKNKNFKEVDGDILLPPEVFTLIDDLNWGWRAFCSHIRNNPKKKLHFDINFFINQVNNHILSHRTICWVNRVMFILKENFGFDQFDAESIAKSYNEDFNPFKLAIQVVLTQIGDYMHTYEIPEAFLTGNYASSIEELNQEEYIYFIGQMLEMEKGMIDNDLFKYNLLLKIAQIKLSRKFKKQLKKKDTEGLAKLDHLLKLASKLDSFFITEMKDNQEVKVLDIVSVKCLINKVLKYYGPEDMMQHSNFFEYRTAHGYFREFINDNDETALNKLVATLYRPKKKFLFIRRKLKNFSSDLRQELTSDTNPLRLEKRAMKIGKLPFPVKYGILLFFYSIEKQMRSGKLIIDGNECDMNILYEGHEDAENEKYPGIGLPGLLFTMAETKVFGNVKETDSQCMWDIIARIYQVAVDNKKQIENMKNNGQDK